MPTFLEVNSMYIPSLEVKPMYIANDEFNYEGCVELILHNEKISVRVFPEDGNWESWGMKRSVNINLYLNLQASIKTCKYNIEKTVFTKVSRWIYEVYGKIVGNESEGYHLLGFPEIELDKEILDYYHHLKNKDSTIMFTAGIWGDNVDS